jgi:hypothetical protein
MIAAFRLLFLTFAPNTGGTANLDFTATMILADEIGLDGRLFPIPPRRMPRTIAMEPTTTADGTAAPRD